jgi:predicted alpha-1,2-mannosidase
MSPARRARRSPRQGALRRGAALAAALLCTAAATTSAHAAGTGTPPFVTDPAALVDPFVGTGDGGAVVGQVDTFPGAAVPFGMTQFSPDTPSRPPGGGYDYADSSILGFALTHLSGAGCYAEDDLPILPVVGALPSNPTAATDTFTHTQESAGPGSYDVTLNPNSANTITTRLTATTRTGLASFTYPRTTQARVLVKVADSANGSSAATFNVVNDHEITGSVTSGHFCGQPDTYTVYFAASFDRPFTASGTWGGTSAGSAVHHDATSITARGVQHPGVTPQTTNGAGDRTPRSNVTRSTPGTGVIAGGYLTFDTTHDPTVAMRTAISYTSVAGAEDNLAAERGFDVGGTAATARAAWNRALGAISIAGGTAEQQKIFYSSLYHALLQPNVVDDADGAYLGLDGKVHQDAPGHHQYSNYSGWDIYRCEVPLLALIAPRQAADMATSLINDERQGGWLPKWPVDSGYTGVMNGDSADPILSDIYAFGVHDFDAKAAVAAMVHGAQDTGDAGQGWYVERPSGAAYIADGYVPNVASQSISPVPNGASETLEYALDDFAIARLAQATGDTSDARTFLNRSQNWSNLFNTSTGYIEPRDAAGAFPSGDPTTVGQSSFGQSGFQEGDAAQYTWMVPQNFRALFQGMGGDSAVRARLDAYFTQLNAGPNAPYHWQGNEPSLDTPWAYDSAGAPYETQKITRTIATSLYADTPGGEPGNDDLGAMSSWYVWAALGMYPQAPGVPMLVLGSPLFPSATVRTGEGTIRVTAPQAATDAPYVQRLSIDGHTTQRTYLMLDGRSHQLDYTLSGSPDTAWGTAADDAPPSFGAGPVSFPPSTRATLTVSPQQLRVAPGAASTITATLDNSKSQTSTTMTLTATSPSGITVSPTSATVSAAAGANASTTFTLTPAADLAAGYYQVALAAKTSQGAVIPTTNVLVTVAAPGESIPTAYVSDYSDDSVTPISLRTDAAGPAIPVGSGPDGEVVTPDGRELFVANNNSDNVTVINTATNEVTATIPVGRVAADVAVTPDGKTVWVSDFGDGTVTPIDTATNTAGTPIAVGTQPERIAINSAGTRLYVVNQGSGSVSVIDLASRQVIDTIQVGAEPFGVAFDPSGATAYVTNGGSNSVSVIDTATGQVTSTVAVGSDPQGVRVSPDGSVVYVTDNGAGGVTPIDTATETAGAFIPTGSGAYAVAFSPDGSTAWVVDSNTNQAQSIDVATGAVSGSVTTGNVPDGITITPTATASGG